MGASGMHSQSPAYLSPALSLLPVPVQLIHPGSMLACPPQETMLGLHRLVQFNLKY